MSPDINKVIFRHEGNMGDLNKQQLMSFEGPWVRRVGKDNISHVSLPNHDTTLKTEKSCQEIVIYHSI